MKDQTLNFLDLETTGINHYVDRVIEVYVTKVRNDETIDTYHTFVNPGFRPSEFILGITQIDPEDLIKAPSFSKIAKELHEFLGEDTLVAHNASFDNSFLRSEFRKQNLLMMNDYCCTVKLSRFLYPEYRRHNLDSIIERIQFESGNRHRADYDTEVIRRFYYLNYEKWDEDTFKDAFNYAVKKNLEYYNW